LAWQIATVPAKRHTLLLRDVGTAVSCTSVFDFLIDVITPFKGALQLQLDTEELNPQQHARIVSRRSERLLARTRLVEVNVNASRQGVARQRPRLHGRFLGRDESTAIEMLARTASDPGPSRPNASKEDPASNSPTPDAWPQPQGARPLAVAPVHQPQARPALPASPLARGPDAADDEHERPDREGPATEDRLSVLPLANIARVMAQRLPEGVKIANDAKECMCSLAGEMAAFVTMEASSSCSKIGTEELLKAFATLGLGGFMPAIKFWMGTFLPRMAGRSAIRNAEADAGGERG